jgi:hypothetical protein
MESPKQHGERVNLVDSSSISITQNSGQLEGVSVHGTYTVECYDVDGKMKWSDVIHNLVVTVGKNDLLDKYFQGTSYTAAWYLGLINSGGSYSASDTMAIHGGWTENTSYSNATRPAPTWNAASTGSKSTNGTSFSINASGTLGGAFLTTSNTKGGTSGTLYSAGNFVGGNRSVNSGDTLSITYTASA